LYQAHEIVEKGVDWRHEAGRRVTSPHVVKAFAEVKDAELSSALILKSIERQKLALKCRIETSDIVLS
jgi:hypothetical protein